MKKIILTLSVFALTLVTVAQTNTPHVYSTRGTVGFVNVRAGAGDSELVLIRKFVTQITKIE